jgi:hypothetical protein
MGNHFQLSSHELHLELIKLGKRLYVPSRGGRVTPLSVVRCPLSVDQIGINIKSCLLMAES